ncbi:hypothetical protein BH11PAT1_BH11PAT1_1700 [soil metagenome]
MKLPKSLTTVTTFSKLLALWLYLFLPFAGFYLGMQYQEGIAQRQATILPSISPLPTSENIKEEELTGQLVSPNYKKYMDSTYGFSFEYPSTMRARKSVGGNFYSLGLQEKNSYITIWPIGTVGQGPFCEHNTETSPIVNDFIRNTLIGKESIINDNQYCVIAKNDRLNIFLITPNTPSEKNTALKIISSIKFSDKTVTPSPIQKACTMEAKQCPDGSYVSRSGPNCAFTPCKPITP